MQFEAFAGLKKGAGNPAGREAEKAARFADFSFDFGFRVAFEEFEGCDEVHWFGEKAGAPCRKPAADGQAVTLKEGRRKKVWAKMEWCFALWKAPFFYN